MSHFNTERGYIVKVLSNDLIFSRGGLTAARSCNYPGKKVIVLRMSK
jgi:hypothetical protein